MCTKDHTNKSNSCRHISLITRGISWGQRTGITKIIRIDPLRSINTCSNIYQDILLKTQKCKHRGGTKGKVIESPNTSGIILLEP